MIPVTVVVFVMYLKKSCTIVTVDIIFRHHTTQTVMVTVASTAALYLTGTQ